jgi:PAS domain S-box-containing protein
LNIRTRVVLAIVCSTLLLSAILFAILNTVFGSNFSRLENAQMVENLNRIKFAIENEEITLNKLSSNWGAWDETYQFVEDVNLEYIKENFVDQTFLSSEFNVIAIINNSGNLVYGADFDLIERKLAPLSPIAARAVTDGFLLSRDASRGKIGMVQTEKGPLLIGTNPILKSNGEGPIHGTVILGRYIDGNMIGKLSFLTKMQVNVSPLSELYSDTAADMPPLSLRNPVAVKPVSSQTLSGYLLMSDFKGQPYVVINTQTARAIYAQSKALNIWLYVSIPLLAISLVIVTMLLLDRLVLNRLRVLHKFTTRIADNTDISQRVLLNGKDELAALGNEMNAMLARLASVNEQLVESENKYSTLVKSASDGIFIISKDEVTYANPRILQMTGLSRKEFQGIRHSDIICPQYEEKAITQYHNLLYRRPADESYEIEIRHKNGTCMPVEVTSKLIRLNHEDCIMMVLRDITERKQAAKANEEALKNEKTLRQDLEEEVRTSSQFIDVLAHELRTPLTPILVSLEMLKESLRNETGRIQYKLAYNALSGAETLRSRLEELLDLARFSRGVFSLKLDSINTSEFLQTAAERYSPTLENKQQDLVIRAPSTLPRIIADPSRLEQVIVNLLSNASKYSGKRTTITLEASEVPEGIQVSVKDQGIGIPPEEAGKLFAPYRRVERDSRKYPGIGLGLSVCKKIIEAHKGRIWVESELGAGSTFKFILPLSGDPPSAPSQD